MDFGSWLILTRRLSLTEYQRVLQHQFATILAGKEGIYSARRFEDALVEMDFAPQVCQRNQASLDEMIEQFRRWHLQHLEPIASYSLESAFGRSLYVNQIEKKAVAALLVTTHTGKEPSIVHYGDTVIIADGSSTFYAGLAIARDRNSTSVITNNTALIREYSENPHLARSFRDFHVIGGVIEADSIQPDFATAGGNAASHAFERAIRSLPHETVVILSCSGFLPNNGPFSPTARQAATNHALIRASTEGDVRELVFVCDYTKHLEVSMKTYGVPIVSPDMWRELVHDHRVALLTCPPPGPPDTDRTWMEYRAAAEQFRVLLKNRFYEVARNIRDEPEDLAAVGSVVGKSDYPELDAILNTQLAVSAEQPRSTVSSNQDAIEDRNVSDVLASIREATSNWKNAATAAIAVNGGVGRWRGGLGVAYLLPALSFAGASLA